jgi:hypothetical protein
MLWKILTSLDTACGHGELPPLILFTHVASTSVTSHTPLSRFLLIFAGCQVLSSHTSPYKRIFAFAIREFAAQICDQTIELQHATYFPLSATQQSKPSNSVFNIPFSEKKNAVVQLVEALRYNP